MIEWAAYTRPESFANKFQKQTGCKIHRKDAGSSDEMFALMHANGGGGGGQYDLVSASGDASLRLIYAHDVKPINVKLIPSWKQFLPIFKSPAHNTVERRALRRLGPVGPEHADLQHEEGEAGSDELERRSTARSTRARHGPEQPDPDRRRGALPEKTKPSLGIKDPYELTQAQLTATVKLLKRQKPLLKRYWNYATDEITSFKNGDVWLGAGWPYQTLAAPGGEGAGRRRSSR